MSQDEKEAGVRALLNFGHSFGHAIEAETNYSRYLHGEAVSIGMVIAARLSEIRDFCKPGTAKRLATLLHSLGLPVILPADISINGLTGALALDKKAVVSGLRLVLLKATGDAVIDSQSSQSDILAALEQRVSQE